MKVNIQRRVLPALLTLIIAVIAVFGTAVSASAAVIDPSSYGDYVVDGDNIIYSITDKFDLFYWRMIADGSLSSVGTGPYFSQTLQMRWVDNHQLYLYPLGYNSQTDNSNFVDLNSYPLGSSITFNADFELSIPDSTQSYGTDLRIYWQFWDASYNSLGFNAYSYPIESGEQLRIYQVRHEFVNNNPSARYFTCFLMWDFSGVVDENDTSSVTIDTDAYSLSFSFPVDRLAQLIDQGKLTNEQLGKIDQALKDNGQKLDAITGDIQQNGEKLDDVNDHLNDIFNGTQEGQEAADDFADKAEQQGQQMGELNEKLESVEKPDISDVDFSMEALMDKFITDEFNFIIRLLWNNDLIYQILLMSAVLMLVSYILFGKKV